MTPSVDLFFTELISPNHPNYHQHYYTWVLEMLIRDGFVRENRFSPGHRFPRAFIAQNLCGIPYEHTCGDNCLLTRGTTGIIYASDHRIIFRADGVFRPRAMAVSYDGLAERIHFPTYLMFRE